MGIFKPTVIKPLFQLINHINMGQDTRDMANTALFSSIYSLIQYLAFIPAFISNLGLI